MLTTLEQRANEAPSHNGIRFSVPTKHFATDFRCSPNPSASAVCGFRRRKAWPISKKLTGVEMLASKERSQRLGGQNVTKKTQRRRNWRNTKRGANDQKDNFCEEHSHAPKFNTIGERHQRPRGKDLWKGQPTNTKHPCAHRMCVHFDADSHLDAPRKITGPEILWIAMQESFMNNPWTQWFRRLTIPLAAKFHAHLDDN